MYSLVQFGNNEYSGMESKRIKIIQGTNCIVKYRGGAKYSATIKHSSDSKVIVSELKKKLIEDNSSKTSSKNLDENPAKCEQSSKVENISPKEVHFKKDKTETREDEHLQSVFDPHAVIQKIKKKLINNYSSKTSDGSVDNNPSERRLSKVKKVLQKKSQDSSKDPQAVTKKIKKELINNYSPKTSGGNVDNNSSECGLSEVKDVIEKQSQHINLNDTYISNKRIDDKFDPDISCERNNDNVESSFGITFEATELNKAINLSNEKSLATIFDTALREISSYANYFKIVNHLSRMET